MTRLAAARASARDADCGLRGELAFGGARAARRASAPGALDVGDQRAEAQQDVLVAGQLSLAAQLEQLGERVMGERGDVGADRRDARVERLELARRRVVVIAARLEVLLPAVRARSSSP